MEQRVAAQLAAERDRVQREAGERASEAHRAETARLQQIAEHMDRRAREAEEKAASHAAELVRVQKEADERAAQAAEQVRAQWDAERAAQQAHRHEETEAMARRAREAEDRVAAQAAELELLRKEATEGAVQGAGGSAMALAQLQNETLEGPAEPAPENIPLPLDDDTTMAGLAPENVPLPPDDTPMAPENVPLPPGDDTPMAEPARRVTQLDVSGLMARWRERAALLDTDDAPLPRNTHTPVKRRRAKLAGIRKSRMQYKQGRRAVNRTANHISAINDQSQQNADNRGSVPRLQIDESCGADVPAPPSHPQGVQSETNQARATDAPAAGDDAEVERAIADNLDEMLEGDAEQRAAGEHDVQERTRWEREQRALLEIEHGALVENTRIESEKRVAQERALALAQLQSQVADETTDSAQRESNTATATLSRPITRFDARSVITGWRQRGSVLGNDEARPPRDTHKKTPTGHQRVNPAGIKKSRTAKQAANRAGGHIAAMHTRLGWHPEDPSSTPVPQIREPSSATNMPATQAAVPNQLEGNAE
ncbi:hypothetical protein I7I51_00999, partial [Histoplasma capsulatum]